MILKLTMYVEVDTLVREAHACWDGQMLGAILDKPAWKWKQVKP